MIILLIVLFSCKVFAVFLLNGKPHRPIKSLFDLPGEGGAEGLRGEAGDLFEDPAEIVDGLEAGHGRDLGNGALRAYEKEPGFLDAVVIDKFQGGAHQQPCVTVPNATLVGEHLWNLQLEKGEKQVGGNLALLGNGALLCKNRLHLNFMKGRI